MLFKKPIFNFEDGLCGKKALHTEPAGNIWKAKRISNFCCVRRTRYQLFQQMETTFAEPTPYLTINCCEIKKEYQILKENFKSFVFFCKKETKVLIILLRKEWNWHKEKIIIAYR